MPHITTTSTTEHYTLSRYQSLLNGRLAEIVGVALHRQAVYAYYYFVLYFRIVLTICLTATCDYQYPVCNEIFSGSVALYDRFDQILRYICIINKQLFPIFRQAVTATSVPTMIRDGYSLSYNALDSLRNSGLKMMLSQWNFSRTDAV